MYKLIEGRNEYCVYSMELGWEGLENGADIGRLYALLRRPHHCWAGALQYCVARYVCLNRRTSAGGIAFQLLRRVSDRYAGFCHKRMSAGSNISDQSVSLVLRTHVSIQSYATVMSICG